jgi:hypothetical protein
MTWDQPTSRALTRRVQAECRPKQPDLHNPRMIHLQGGCGSATHGRSTEYGPKFGAPTKMSVPILQARVKQTDAPARDFVTSGDAISFCVVANRGGETQGLQIGGAIQSARNDVFNLKRLGAKVLLQPAILT